MGKLLRTAVCRGGEGEMCEQECARLSAPTL